MTNEQPSVLVTGGAGYIGSHIARVLHKSEYHVVVLDSLITGDRTLVPEGVTFYEGDIADAALVREIIGPHAINSVIHCAALVDVAESVREPSTYRDVNTEGTRILADACAVAGVKRFVFSSTAAVYGEPPVMPVSEDVLPDPQSPYGETKLMAEEILREISAVSGMAVLVLRYFNVAGVGEGGGYPHKKEPTHLIRRAVWTALGRFPEFHVFGTDYDTPDGTAMRDFIHVTDLADVHVVAIEYLEKQPRSAVLNCGYAQAYSVLEVLETVQRLTGVKLEIVYGDRRAGDLPVVVADTTKLAEELRWTPQHNSLDQIVESELAYARSLL